MGEEGYRKTAWRTLLAAVVIASFAHAIGILNLLVAPHAFRELAVAVTRLCLRAWAALPSILQSALVISVAVGLVSGVLWLLSAGKQWRKTADSLRSLRRKAVDPPPRILPLLMRHALTQHVTVVKDARPFAFTVGLIAPHILVSTALIETLDDVEFEAVLLHELSHLRSKDPLYLLLARALAAAFFYVPVVRVLTQRYQAAIELAADEFVIARQDGSRNLSAAMLKLLQARPSMGTPFTGAADLRLSHLLGQRTGLPGLSQRSVLLSVAAVVAIVLPMVTAYGVVGMLDRIAFFSQCPV